MNKLIAPFFILIVFFCFQIGKIRALYIEKTAPRLKLDNHQVSFEIQKSHVIQAIKDICSPFIKCTNATQKNDENQIFVNCELAIKKINKAEISNELPISVIKNLKIYQQSLINSSHLLIEAYQTQGNGKRGASALTFMKYWEVDTCTEKSIPQKIMQLYGIDRDLGKKIVTCEEL